MNNTNGYDNSYYGLCGFLSGGILVFLLNYYKISNLEKKIKELEETKINLIEHLMYLDSPSCNSTHRKKATNPNNYYSNYEIHSNIIDHDKLLSNNNADTDGETNKSNELKC